MPRTSRLASTLPDELISQILSPAVKVDDAEFCDTSAVSPFATYSESRSSSAVLLVCKSWLRVATPMLYNVVVLRSEGQARALARTLNANSDLARFIKKLRVEGGFGGAMNTILRYTTKVTDLFLTLSILSGDSTSGLCEGLAFITPKRLMLQDQYSGAVLWDNFEWTEIRHLVVALGETIAGHWERLETFHWSADRLPESYIFSALNGAGRLKTLVIPKIRYAVAMSDALGRCPLHTLQILHPVEDGEVEEFVGDHRVARIVQYSRRMPVANEVSGTAAAMGHASAGVQEAVWSRVLYFACAPRGRKLAFLLVSRMFHRVGLRHFYERVRLGNWQTGAERLVSLVRDQPALAQHIRMLQGDPRSKDAKLYNPFTWSGFEDIVALLGTSLLELNFMRTKASGKVSPDILNRLPALRRLEWTSGPPFDLSSDDEHAEALPNLQELLVGILAGQTFVSVLEGMKLPALECAVLGGSLSYGGFLQVHGSKLTGLSVSIEYLQGLRVSIFNLCPQLREIVVDYSTSKRYNPPALTIFQPTNIAAHLETVVFWMSKFAYIKPKLTFIPKWVKLLESFKSPKFPTLRRIAMTSHQWPKSNFRHAIVHRPLQFKFIAVAEFLLQDNILFLDADKRAWRPRLQPTSIEDWEYIPLPAQPQTVIVKVKKEEDE
ncbi:hypothetical protein C8F01DRAFT_1376103 [Mycena amicta]|nr:hypothetical protein C8F01DRAFT_1376103 [Mycena amicta]